MKRLSLFYQCLLLSLGVHTALLWVLFIKPLILQPTLTTSFGKGIATTSIPTNEEDINLSEKNITLEEVFNQIVVFSPNAQQPFDLARTVSGDFGKSPVT